MPKTTPTQPTTAPTTPAAAPAPTLTSVALTDVQAQMGRVDTKAAMLLAGALTALAGGTAVLAKAHLPGAATTTGVTCLIGSAVMLLITAVRPALRGNHGFMRWANATSPAALATDLTQVDTTDYDHTALWNLSRFARRKFQLIRVAVDLIRLALLFAALTGLLAAL